LEGTEAFFFLVDQEVLLEKKSGSNLNDFAKGKERD